MPRSSIESEQWVHLLDSLEGVMLNPSKDRWSWDLNGQGNFQLLRREGPLYALQSARFREENEGAEKVVRVYIKTLYDRAVKKEKQDKMIAKWPPSNVCVIDREGRSQDKM
nr:methylesterase 17-like [Tanacetum cinerariifolium]